MDELEKRLGKMHLDDNDVTMFISNVENCYQSLVLLRLFSNHSDLYLSDYSKGQEEGEINIGVLGSKRRNTRSRYTVKLIDKSFTCNCSDFTYRASKLGIVCKHVCFLMFRVARIFSMSFIDTKRLSDREYREFVDTMNNNILWKTSELSVKALNTKFRDLTKDMEDCSCPICFDAINDSNSVACPDCKNHIHENCMMVWLESFSTCVYCRSTSWREYVSL
jgi:hypothetical protein